MKLKAYSIYDKKSLTYAKPFYFHQDGEALRAFDASVQGEQSQLNQFPEDFDLYYVGDFDQITGKTSTAEPKYIGKASDYKRKPPLVKGGQGRPDIMETDIKK